MSPQDYAPLLDIEAVAQRLGVGDRFVRRLVEEHRIPYLKIGKYVRFDEADLQRWIEQRRVSVGRSSVSNSV